MKKLENPLTQDEAEHCIELKSTSMNLEGKRLRKFRRDIRYRLFRLREGKSGQFDQGLRKLIEAQFDGSMTWQSFTFNWDVAADDPLKVITPFEWLDHGGTFDDIPVIDEKGISKMTKFCDPPAFTKQEI